MKAVLRFLLAAALLVLCAAAQRPVYYKAALVTAPGYVRLNHTAVPSGTAIVTVYNTTYATVAFTVRSVVDAFMAHIHNGTLPGEAMHA